jgi:mannosylglycerate hydrolase
VDVTPVHDLDSRPWPFYMHRHCFYMETGEIPACGYKLFKAAGRIPLDTIGANPTAQRKSTGKDIAGAPGIMENEYLRVEVRPDGTVDMLGKAAGKLYCNLNYYEDTGDCGDYWTYYPPYNNKTYTSKGCNATIWVEDNGPLSATIAAEIGMSLPACAIKPDAGIRGESKRSDVRKEFTVTTWYTLKRGSKKLDVKVKVDNTVEDHRFRVMFDTGIKSQFSYAAGHFTVDKRPVEPVKDNNGEYYPEMQNLPQQSFVDLSDGRDGIAFINNCLSEFEARDDSGKTLALTLFRSVRNAVCTEWRVWARFPEEKGGQCPGIQEYEYSIYPHAGFWDEAEVYHEANRFNVPLKPVQTSVHEGGILPPESGFLSIDNKNLVLSALKKSEDRDTFVLRLYNPSDSAAKGVVRLLPKIREAYFTNLNEERLEKLAVTAENAIELDVGSNKIVTVELVFDEDFGRNGYKHAKT